MNNLFNKIKKTTVQNNSTTYKNFSYTKGDVTLKFDLRTDIKTQLKDFAELLEVAISEVKEEIEK
jgi:hypothetical protein